MICGFQAYIIQNTHERCRWSVLADFSLCWMKRRLFRCALSLLSLQAGHRWLLDSQGLHGGVQKHFPCPLSVPETGHLRGTDGQLTERGE